MNTHRIKFLIFCYLIISCLTITAFAQKVSLENPALLGSLLIDKPDIESMREICEYYDFHEESSENGFSVFKGEDGIIIRIKKDSKIPIIEVAGFGKTADLKKMLEKVGYRKTSKGYIKGSEFTKFQNICTLKSNPASLTFTKVRNTSHNI